MTSIIIPTFNAAKYLEKLLFAIQQQNISQHELIIIDSSSTDNTVEIAKKFTDNIVIIPQNEFDHGGTRTLAVKIAKGDILIYLTQDALPLGGNAIQNIITTFEDKSIGAAYGRQISYKDTNIFGKHLREFNYGAASYIRSYEDRFQYGIKTAFLSDSFAAYQKAALEEIGFFKDGLIVGEDTYAGAKIMLSGYKIAYVADAIVYHSHGYTIWQEFKRYFDIGVFHANEKWILNEFGKAEGEGLRYIKSEIAYLKQHNKLYLLPAMVLRNGAKFIAYKLGQNYKKIPKAIIKKISMHSGWWCKNF